MIYFILGLLTGLILDCILFLTLLYFKSKIETRINQITSKVKVKGRILENEQSEVSDWINTLPDKK